jgi:formylmethanofuran dehydrogenase subunit E
MRWQPMQLELEVEAHHRALRRCHGCGSYVRHAEEKSGVLRCERCAEKARRAKEHDEFEEEDFSIVR